MNGLRFVAKFIRMCTHMKKLWHSTIALILILAALFIPAVTAEEAPTKYTSGDYRYTLQPDGTAAIVKYTGSASILSIPDTLDGYAVTAIGNEAFRSCESLKNITIPDSVTSIGDGAFSGCSSLTSVTIPDGVTSIGGLAFSSCKSLTNISIPDSVTGMGVNPFIDCENLTQIIVSPDHPVFADIDGVLFHKPTKTLICYPQSYSQASYVIPDGIAAIGDRAFSFCSSLTSVAIPNGVTSIGDYAFVVCDSLTSITIPNSVTAIGEDAFFCCASLTSITIPDSVTSIAHSAFSACESLTLTVSRDSWAEEWCKDNGMDYIYSDAHN